MKRILVPYDFSKVSEYALNLACQISERIDSAIMLLHVIEHPTINSFKTMGVPLEDPMEQIYIKKMYENIQKKLHEIIMSAEYSDKKIASKIQLGNPFNTIINQITEEKVSLIIVGTDGSEGLNEFFVGSNAEKIVRYAQCPVITVQNQCKNEPIKKIIFASDFEHTQDPFVNQIKDLQRTFDAQLNIVKINTPSSFTSTRNDMKQMTEFVKKYAFENYTIDIYNNKNEEDGIMLYAEDIQADMIAVGTHQKKGIGHFLVGSIAENIVNNSKIPIWTANL